jgi:hypothetical protein
MIRTSLASSLSSRTYTVYCDTMPFGCSGGFQLTKMESPDITRAFTALGASGTAMHNSCYNTQMQDTHNQSYS